VPRAELFKLPPPKAQLVRLPWKVGSLHRVVMPYNIEVTARYKGVLSSEAKLPKNGNALGDMWMVGSTPWLWLVAPGASQADWIDP